MLMPLGMGGQVGAGPEADPSSATATIPVTNIEIDWTNGDSDAYTEIGQSYEVATEPTFAWDEVAPGVTTYDTGITDVCPFWWVRHRKGGIPGNWVAASDSFSRAGCPS